MDLAIAEFAVRSERDVTWAGQRARLLASLADLQHRRKSDFGKAVTIAARRAVDVAG